MADTAAVSRTEWLAQQLGQTTDVTLRFHMLSYYSGALQQTYWLGVPLQKSPLDCWIYQEIIDELRPDLIIETGTDLGGSALFLASMCDLVGHGRVVSIDIRESSQVQHPRITYLVGDSTSKGILDRVREATHGTKNRLVILDSDHSAYHVARELRVYREFVSLGNYLVVEDTNVNGHPVMPEHGPGPFEAVHTFLDEDTDFRIDRSREKFLLTYFPDGFLKRVSASGRSRDATVEKDALVTSR